MLNYLTLFLLFLYFKVARVHKKEEKFTRLLYAQHILVSIAAIALFMQCFETFSWFAVLSISFFFFIISALIVTAVQLGIFVDGKPIIGIGKLYKLMPFLAFLIVAFSFKSWVF